MKNDVTAIIPTLREAPHLGTLLADLLGQTGVELTILVADGGSDDGTQEVARSLGATVVTSEAGRGRQMNAAARQATSTWLFFVHADTGLPRPDLLQRALQRLWDEGFDDPIAGHFPLRFPSPTCRGCLRYRYLERKSALGRPHTIHGDQGLLIRRSFFESLGGFHEELPFLEDQVIAAQIRQVGRFLTLPGYLQTSTRRFDDGGFFPTYLQMAVVMGAFVAECPEFFDACRQIYAEKSGVSTGELLRAVAVASRQMAPLRSLRRWARVGRFVRRNAYQIPLAVDIACEPLVGPDGVFLPAFEEWIEERLEASPFAPALDVTALGLTVLTLLAIFAAVDDPLP